MPRYFKKHGQDNGENMVRLPAEAKIFLFFKASRTALEPTQTTINRTLKPYPCAKGVGVWNWLLTSIECRDLECMEIYKIDHEKLARFRSIA
jgi:hypothetical protein